MILTPGTTEPPITTTDATPSTLISVRWPENIASTLTVYVMGKTSAGAVGAYYRRATFKRVTGSVSQVGSTTDLGTHEDSAGWDVTFSASGADVAVVVTGAAATTVRWQLLEATNPGESRNWMP